jgi:hypothetical protein
MRLPRVRFTVRRLMVIVAIVGMAIGLSRWLWLRSLAFDRLAGFHSIRSNYGNPLDANVQMKLTYHNALWNKYRRAARHPWLPIEPDPPEPESSLIRPISTEHLRLLRRWLPLVRQIP